jgi:hypothetical protein
MTAPQRPCGVFVLDLQTGEVLQRHLFDDADLNAETIALGSGGQLWVVLGRSGRASDVLFKVDLGETPEVAPGVKQVLDLQPVRGVTSAAVAGDTLIVSEHRGLFRFELDE